MDRTSTDRRSVVLAAVTLGSSALAGCVGNALPGSRSDSTEGEAPGTETATSTPDRPAPSALIDEFLEAARAENEDALADVLHTESPIHPTHYEGTEWEFQGEGYESYEYSNATVVEGNASVDDVAALEGIDFWFQDRSLEDVLGDAELNVVSVDVESDSREDQPRRWVLAREDDEWRIFWMGRAGETPDDPEAAFEEPIADEDADVVAEVEWDVDPVDHAGPTPSERFAYAKVRLTDSPGIEAERVRIESTVAGGEFEFYNPEDSETTNTWAGNWANVRIDPDGDQIVVTAVQNDSEEIVYRRHYRPDGEA